ncbi:thiolase family protein [bacterium]|nr:MAG: thiolase family protein [bacterium]
MGEPVIVDAVRTPIGKAQGGLRGVPPDALLAHVLDALVGRSGVDPRAIEDVVVGCVTQAGEQGANVGRLGVLLSRLPVSVPAVTLDRMCGSAQQAIHFAAQAVAAGDQGVVVAGGVESMTRVPMFSDIGGGFERLDPALFERHEMIHQGESAERIAARYGLSRHDLDAFGYESHRRGAQAAREGYHRREMAPLAGLERDEGVRLEPSLERMLALPPAYRSDGVITAGNASQISDGAAAVLIADRGRAAALGLRARARFRARVVVAGDPTLQLLEVIPATHRALERAGLRLEEIDVVEINEAFASVVLAWAREMERSYGPLDMERVNPNGGAIAHGHPLGATGAVLLTKLLHELERRGGHLGLQVMCIGHGMATATIIERL